MRRKARKQSPRRLGEDLVGSDRRASKAAAIAHQQAGAPILTHTEQGDQRQPSRRRLLRVRCWLARCWKRQQPACSAIDMADKKSLMFSAAMAEDRSTSEGILIICTEGI